MDSASTRFMAWVAALTAVCAGLLVLWNLKTPAEKHLTDGYLMLGIFAASTLGVHLFLLRAAKDKSNAFIRAFMASSFLKFLFYVVMLVLFLLFTTDNKQVLAAHFIVYYVVFTVLEVSMLYSAMRQNT